MALLAFNDTLAIWHVYVISLLSGFVEAFFQPAYRAAVPEVTPEADLPSANSLTSLSAQFGGITGPAAGATLVALGDSPLAFALDSLSFFISALCLLPLLKQSVAPQNPESSSGILGDLREGLATVLSSPWLCVTIWLGRFARLRHRGLTLYGAWMIVGVMVVLIGLPVPAPVMLTAAFVMGVCGTILSLVWVNTLQERVPAHLLGRVTSVDYLGSYILLPVGYAFGGWAAEQIGPSLLFIIGGTLQALLIALGLLHREIRALD